MLHKRFIIDVCLEEDDMSWHGTVGDFERDILSVLNQCPYVLVFDFYDEETNEAFYDGSLPRQKQIDTRKNERFKKQAARDAMLRDMKEGML